MATPSKSNAYGRPAGSRPSSVIVTRSLADALAELDEAALLLDGEGTEAEVAEHVEDVDDGVLLEDDRVVAGVDGDGVGGRTRLVGRFAADRRRVDRRAVDGGRLRVAGARRPAPSTRSAAGRRSACRCWRAPFELATATVSVPVENEP